MGPTPEFEYKLERSVTLRAMPSSAFAFFTDSERWASWWGAGSTIDAHPGGKVYIRHPNGVESTGEILEVAATERIVFTYGFASGKPISPGASRVTVRLEPEEAGTRLHLRHEFSNALARDEHVQGWRFQLSVLGNVVANETFADVAQRVDQWYALWGMGDAEAREEKLRALASPRVTVRDRFSLLEGVEDVSNHIGAWLRFMPEVTLQRSGGVRHCQGAVLTDWAAVDSQGKQLTSGASVFVFDGRGRIELMTSFS